MKSIVLLAVMILLVALVPAQETTPWQFLRHSDLCAGGNVYLRFDTMPGSLAEYSLYTSISGTAWIEQPLTDQSVGVKEAYVPYQVGQNMRYRVRTVEDNMGEEMVTLNPAYLISDGFPLALNTMAFVAEDAVGDTVMIDIPALDLTGSYSAVSDSKLYATLENATGTFPTLVSLTNYNLYMVGIINPESVTGDSTMYAMVYTFNITGVISTGLYKVGMTSELEPTFERLGNIQSVVSGGKLHLACNFGDLTADPAFGDWPNQSSSLIISGMTMRISIDIGTMQPSFFVGDYTNPALLVCHNHVYQRSYATPPNLQDVSVVDMGASKMVQATYYDPNQDFPLVFEVALSNGNSYQMQTAVPDFSEPTLWTAIVPADGWTSGVISVSDTDITTYEYPITTSITDPETAPAALTCHFSNPVTGAAKFHLDNLETGNLSVSIHNLRGQKVQDLYADRVGKGTLEITWNGTLNGIRPASGIYFLRVTQNGRHLTRKFMYLR
ncbi:MAG: T9SS type A sorting domain-containing protein [Candidatus Cloacimonetes bacterium]|nr:T9SS type A sorting domain-containing protein [Candidatus Cloacimonadota bacterium]